MTVNATAWNVGTLQRSVCLPSSFVMTAKPDGSIAWLFPVIGAVVGPRHCHHNSCRSGTYSMRRRSLTQTT
jgi:hypothetical protein